MIALDIGAGSHFTHVPRAVNINATVKTDVLLTDENRWFIDVVCDVQYLPFRDNIFDVVFCSHVIEHTENPLLSLKEVLRVTKADGVAEVCTPYRFSNDAKSVQHKHYFNKKWFLKTLRHFHIRVNYRPRPNAGLTLSIPPIPIELHVIICKKY